MDSASLELLRSFYQRTRLPLAVLLFGAVLYGAWEAKQRAGASSVPAAVVTTPPPAKVAVIASSPPAREEPHAAPPETVMVSQKGRTPRFGLVTILRDTSACLTIEGDSLADSTAVSVLAMEQRERGEGEQWVAKAIVARSSRECADSLGMLDGRKYLLRSSSPTTVGEGIAIVGAIDTLIVASGRAVAKFPGDSAHWSFGTCTSHEGLHYDVERVSADSLITLWDGYRYLGYDTEPTCRGARDIPLAAEVTRLVNEWNDGKRGEDVAMKLLLARWDRCFARWDVGADNDSLNAPPQLPPMPELLRAAGSPDKLSAEDLFVIGWLAGFNAECFGESLPLPAKQLPAEAVRREPSSTLFRTLGGDGIHLGPGDSLRADSVRREVHRRFDGRGERYRDLADWLRHQLPGQ